MITVLILCTGNSARSILGEALLDRLGEGRVRALSAGSRPAGRVHPGALRLLQREGVRAHWGLADPAVVEGSEAEVDAAFAETWRLLKMRIEAFLALPFETMPPSELQRELAAIGRMEGAA